MPSDLRLQVRAQDTRESILSGSCGSTESTSDSGPLLAASASARRSTRQSLEADPPVPAHTIPGASHRPPPSQAVVGELVRNRKERGLHPGQTRSATNSEPARAAPAAAQEAASELGLPPQAAPRARQPSAAVLPSQPPLDVGPESTQQRSDATEQAAAAGPPGAPATPSTRRSAPAQPLQRQSQSPLALTSDTARSEVALPQVSHCSPELDLAMSAASTPRPFAPFRDSTQASVGELVQAARAFRGLPTAAAAPDSEFQPAVREPNPPRAARPPPGTLLDMARLPTALGRAIAKRTIYRHPTRRFRNRESAIAAATGRGTISLSCSGPQRHGEGSCEAPSTRPPCSDDDPATRPPDESYIDRLVEDDFDPEAYGVETLQVLLRSLHAMSRAMGDDPESATRYDLRKIEEIVVNARFADGSRGLGYLASWLDGGYTVEPFPNIEHNAPLSVLVLLLAHYRSSNFGRSLQQAFEERIRAQVCD